MAAGRNVIDDLESAIKSMAGDLDDFAADLRRCQNDMAEVRRVARGAGLSVNGFVVQDPGSGPARPPDGFEGTPAEVAAHNDRVAVYDTHQALIEAYNDAAREAARVDRAYQAAGQALQQKYTVAQHASWIVTLTEILGDSAAGALGALSIQRSSTLLSRAQDLVAEARRAVDDLQAHPERYLRRRWFFFTEIDEVRLEADRLAIQGRLDQAEQLIDEAKAARGATGSQRILRAGGRILGVAGLGLGVYNDYQEGETHTQIAVSQGASFAAGVAAGAGAGALASIGTGAAMGAAFGSVVPGVGTVVGAVVGTAVGAGVAIFADGAIDSLFENGPDVGTAFESGIDALQDTGEAIGSAASGVADTVGGWFS